MSSNQSPLAASDKFVAMFKREPSSPSDLAWMNGYATAIAERVVAELHVETSGDLLLARNALGNLYMAVLKFGPIDRDIGFAMNEAGQLLGSPLQVKTSVIGCKDCDYYRSTGLGECKSCGASLVHCPTCKTAIAFEGDVCGLCNPEVKP